MAGKETLNRWSAKDYVKNIVMLLAKLPLWLVQVCLLWQPVIPNRIIIYSLKQHGYCCNLKYLTAYLNRNHPGAFDILWIVRSQADLEALRRRDIPAALLHSKEHFRWRMRARVVITNDEFYPVFFKRPGQVYINTWHGAINYKKIGYAGLEFTNPIQKLIYRMNNPRPDLFISGSRSFTETTAASFGFPREIFLEAGLPRNDILCRGDEAVRAEVRARLGIAPEQKVVLYAPTFRKGGFGPGQALDYGRVCAALADRFGGEWAALVRQHYFVRQRTEDRAVIDVSGWEDMQELLLCADCLISDYSSCMWDFLITGKPCFVYAPDLSAYTADDRSFFIPMSCWPYPAAEDMAELETEIRNFDPADFEEKAKAHRAEFGSHDSGRACETLTDHLMIYTKE